MSWKSGRFGPAINELTEFDNRTVKTRNTQQWNLDEDYNTHQLSPGAIDKLTALDTTSFLVIKDQKIIFEKYWAPTESTTVLNSFSVAKSIVCTLIGIAIKDKLLRLDDPVARYLPSFAKPVKDKITIEHLLRMTSGLKWIESESSALSHNAEAYYGRSLESLINNLEVRRPPGQVFRYASGNTQILAMLLTKVTKMTLSEYASKKLWSPIGAQQDAFWNLDRPNGLEKAFCCFYATAKDFARIGQLYLNDGRWQDQQIISSEFIDQVLQPSNMPDIWLNKPNDVYGMHWWLAKHAELDFFYARGIRGQYIICNRELNMIIVRMGHRRNPVDRHHGHPPDLFDHINAGLEIITSSPAIAP
ncbi:MAG: serine hydrolase [Saprospiraceae bacterium]|nr:serine hydrolase [Saprospiraceae bacterium]